MLMICENARKCNTKVCTHKTSHEYDGDCLDKCVRMNGISGSTCIPCMEKPFDGAPQTLAKEQERKVKEVEAIIGTKEEPKPLTDHPKYCRLSKQAGGLCGRFAKTNYDDWCTNDENDDVLQNVLRKDWTQCPRPEKQQPAELPKNPLEELINEYADEMIGLKPFLQYESRQFLRKFAEKARAL